MVGIGFRPAKNCRKYGKELCDGFLEYVSDPESPSSISLVEEGAKVCIAYGGVTYFGPKECRHLPSELKNAIAEREMRYPIVHKQSSAGYEFVYLLPQNTNPREVNNFEFNLKNMMTITMTKESIVTKEEKEELLGTAC